MTEPFLDDGDVRIYVGDSRDVLAQLPDQSVHLVATSPPFFGLRDYGTGEWVGGDPDCDHERPSTTMNVGFNERWGQGGGEKRQECKSGGQYAGSCPKCGADRIDHQIGLEATPDEWADSIVDVMREARRVLRDDGSLWVECGDSYAANRSYQVADSKHRDVGNSMGATVPDGLKQTDLIGAPYLLAFALRADGWFWRGQYVWEKPDCMPESIENRCTTSHSTVLHFAKTNEPTFWTHRDGRGTRRRPAPDYVYVSRETGEEVSAAQVAAGSTPDPKRWKRVNLWKGRNYFFDRDAIREPFSDYSTGGDGGSYGAGADAVRVWDGGSRGSTRYVRERPGASGSEHVQPTLDGDVPEPELRGPDGRRAFHLEAGPNSEQHRDGSRWPSLEGRSPRSVWRITTEANSFGLCPACRTFFPERAPARHCGVDVVAHFAVWPHALVGKIIDAATSEAGCCADCGAPRVRRVKITRPEEQTARQERITVSQGNGSPTGVGGTDSTTFGTRGPDVAHLGWQPTCECDATTVPCVVLDPFGGSGTTGRQARASGRHCVLVELSPDYAEIASRRLAQQGLPLVAG